MPDRLGPGMTTARKPALRTQAEPTITEGAAERRLWGAVLESVRHELWSEQPDKAREYLDSRHFGPGSFLWVCEFLDLDPDAVRRVFARRPELKPTDPRR